MRLCTGVKSHKCDICGKCYAGSGSLYTHKKTHTGERDHVCSLCGKAFIEKAKLEKHFATHTGAHLWFFYVTQELTVTYGGC